MTQRYLSLAIVCLSTSIFYVNTPAYAGVAIGVGVGIAPAPVEIVAPPQGYANCYMAEAHFSHGVWINQHRECQYYNSPAIWVSAHWECRHFNSERGSCKHWNWAQSHWASPHVARMSEMDEMDEMGPPPPPGYVAGPPVVMGPQVVVEAPVVVGFGGGHYYRHGWR